MLKRLARTYHLHPPEQPELVSNLHTQLWEILHDGVTLAFEGLYDDTDIIYAPLVADLSPARCFDIAYVVIPTSYICFLP